MKIFVFFLAFLPLVGFSQVKNDSRLTITPKDSLNLFSQVETLLKAEGYKIQRVMPNNRALFTKSKTVGGLETTFVFNFPPDKTILLDGQVLLNMLNPSDIGGRGSMYEKLVYDDYKKSLMKGPWEEMDRIAKKLGSVTYSKP
jgi:hypothetical protein